MSSSRFSDMVMDSSKHLPVLIVEDNSATRDLLASQLAAHGYDVAVAEDGEEALEAIGVREFGAICLDLALPQQGGLSVCETLRSGAKTAETPVLAVTGRASLEDHARAFEAGVTRFLAKPFRLRDLYDHVDAIYGKRHSETKSY